MPNAFHGLLRELESIPTADVPLISWHHKVCFLAVIMEEKPVFALGFDAPVPPRFIQFLDQQAPLLRLILKETPRTPRHFLNRAEVSEAVAKAIADRWERAENASQKILWVLKSRKEEERVDKAVRGELPVHELLDYPECCSKAYWDDRARAVETYERMLYEQFAPADENAVIEMIESNFQVEADLPGAERVIKTISSFPFLPFISCESCLASDESPAALRNTRLRKMMAGIDPISARKITLMARTMANFAEGKR